MKSYGYGLVTLGILLRLKLWAGRGWLAGDFGLYKRHTHYHYIISTPNL